MDNYVGIFGGNHEASIIRKANPFNEQGALREGLITGSFPTSISVNEITWKCEDYERSCAHARIHQMEFGEFKPHFLVDDEEQDPYIYCLVLPHYCANGTNNEVANATSLFVTRNWSPRTNAEKSLKTTIYAVVLLMSMFNIDVNKVYPTTFWETGKKDYTFHDGVSWREFHSLIVSRKATRPILITPEQRYIINNYGFLVNHR